MIQMPPEFIPDICTSTMFTHRMGTVNIFRTEQQDFVAETYWINTLVSLDSRLVTMCHKNTNNKHHVYLEGYP